MVFVISGLEDVSHVETQYCLMVGAMGDILLGVSKNRGTPKWMVKIMENPIKMDDLGGTIIFGNTLLVVRN